MKTIRNAIAVVFLLITSVNANAQLSKYITDQIVGYVIGNIIDGIAEELGASTVDGYTSSTPTNKKVNSDMKAYNKSKSSLMESRLKAYEVINDGRKGEASEMDKDRSVVYAGHIHVPEVSGGASDAIETNYNQYLFGDSATKSLTLPEMLGDRLFTLWSNEKGGASDSKFLSDLYDDMVFLGYIKTCPSAIKIYAAIQELQFRCDKKLLSYLSFYSRLLVKPWSVINTSVDPEVQMGLRCSQSSCLVECGDVIAGSIDFSDGIYQITVAETSDLLMNLYPMAAARYVQGNASFSIDGYGRPVSVEIEFCGDKLLKKKADRRIATELVYLKSNYNVLGQPSSINSGHSDTAFYLAPLNLGGRQNFLNMVPVNPQSSLLKDVKSLDKIASRALKRGDSIKRTITLEYPNNISMRPSRITISQSLPDCAGFVVSSTN